MIKRIYLILVIILLLLLPCTIIKISAQEITIPNINVSKEKPIGTLKIKKININENLYNIDSPRNNIEEHITILKESTFPDLLILAAHSGEGKIAYFEHLDDLKLNDEIKVKYNNKTYIYFVKDIFEQKKDGYININKEDNDQLILTTCSPKHNGYQLIINCIKKESIY